MGVRMRAGARAGEGEVKEARGRRTGERMLGKGGIMSDSDAGSSPPSKRPHQPHRGRNFRLLGGKEACPTFSLIYPPQKARYYINGKDLDAIHGVCKDVRRAW